MSAIDLKKLLLGTTLFAGAAFVGFAPTAAMAQDDDVELIEEEEESEVETSGDTVVVTGSRLRRDEFTSVAPLQVIDGETARDLGLIDAQALLQQSSVISGQQNTLNVSTGAFALGQAFTTVGNVSPSLRGLGSSVTGRTRSLVLVNGRRLGPIGVGGAPANPDISLLPGSLIARTDVLLDGASSVYGSDAVAGVINFVLRDNFDGVELSAYHAGDPESDFGNQQVYSLTTGVSNDRGFVGFAMEYNHQESISKYDVLSDYWGPVDDVQANFGRLGFGADPSGQLPDILCTATIATGPTGERERCNETATGFILTGSGYHIVSEDPYGTYTPFPGAPGFYQRTGNYFRPTNDPVITAIPNSYDNTFLPETSRFSMYTTGEYDLDLYGDMQLFFEGMYANRQLGTRFTSQGILPFTADNPFNPFGEAGAFVFGYANGAEQDIDVLRGVAGVRGDLPAIEFGSVDNFSYELSASFHRSTGSQSRYGSLNEDRLAQGMASYLNPTTQQIECTTPYTDPSNGGASFFGFNTVAAPIACVPLNPFDASSQFASTGQFATDAQNDFVYGTGIQNTVVEQNILNGFVQGDLFDIPTGGTVSALVGFEYRTDSVETTSSDVVRQGSLDGVDADVGSNGSRWLREGFFEIAIPLIENKPLIEALTVEGAARYTEEKNAGSAWTYRGQVSYSPTDWFTADYGYGTSFRAPDTGEQFGTGTIFVTNSRVDPCIVPGVAIDPTTATYDPALEQRSQVVIDNCIALGLDPTTLGTVNQGDPAQLAYTSLPVAFGNFGNIATGPEESTAWFAKATLNQPWFDQFDFQLSATYYDYVIEGSIGQLTRGQILNDCFESVGLSDPLCAFQERDASGTLVAVNEASINLGETTARGFDVNARFGYEFTNLPFTEDPVDFDWNVTFTQSLENTEDVLGNGEPDNNLGNWDGVAAFPQSQAISTMTFGWRDFSLLYRMRYISDLYNVGERGNIYDPCYLLPGEDPSLDQETQRANEEGDITPGPDGFIDGCFEKESLPSYFQHDLTGVYRADTWSLRAGVTNLTDDIEKSNLGLYNVPVGSGHDTFGRRFFIQLQKSF